MPHDVRDQVVDFVRRWSEKTEIGVGRFPQWLGIGASKFYDWRQRYGRVNEHNGWIPRDFWLQPWEKEAIIGFHLKNPSEGYRRLTFMIPTGKSISTTHRRVSSKMYSARPTAFKESKASPARARQPHSPSSAARRSHRAIRSRASPQPPVPQSNWSRRAFRPEHCKAFLHGTNTERNLEQKRLFFIDESSLASTNQMREFLTRLGRTNNDRVLLIGDTRQHQGVEAGRPFEQLQEAGMCTAMLDEIVRQKDPALKSAVELLATGQVSAVLDALQQQGRVKGIPNAEERVRAIAKSYVESPENTLIVSPDNASHRQLNVAVRQKLKATGALAPEDHTFRVLVQRQDMTNAPGQATTKSTT